MKVHLKENYVRNLAKSSKHAVCLGYCAGAILFRAADCIGFTSGLYGWNYDVYNACGVIVCTGYRRMRGKYSAEINAITEKYERLAEHHAKRNMWTRDETRDSRIKSYLLERWARAIRAALNA